MGTNFFSWGGAKMTTAWTQPVSLLAISPPPCTSDPIVHIGQYDIPLATFVGAVSGAVLAILIATIGGWIRNNRDYHFMLGLLKGEVQEISGQVAKRKAHPLAMHPLYPVLPASAWQALIQAPQRRYRLPKKKREPLARLYQAVEVANSYQEIIPTVLQISHLAQSNDARNAFRDEAVRLLTDPLGDLEKFLPAARGALSLSNDPKSDQHHPTGGRL
ncbi:hypothetical protein ACFV98_21170 [Streptomyces violascens]|uniref:hypothetical protein n=1 Tax=Streptomyces violascens TaxID=67381 RepID=UPI00366A1256